MALCDRGQAGLDLGDAVFKVLETPGHTNGSICLLHEDTRTLISGDTVFAGGGVGRWDLETGNYQELLASVETLSRLDVGSFHPGHGPSAVVNAKEQIAASLDYLKQCGRWG